MHTDNFHAHGYMDWGIVALFAMVYLGMILGGLPRLKLDRSGVALLGAIGVIALGGMSTEQAARAVDLPTVLLLFAFMVVSAQMRLGGFYTAITRQVAGLPLGRNALLGAIIAMAGALSAVFSNDIICLAMTPVVAQLCQLAAHQPRAVFAWAGLRGQHRIGGHTHWQSAKHADWLGHAVAVWWLCASGFATRRDQPGAAVGLAGVGARIPAAGA